MATPVNELPAVDPDSGRLNVVVDTPKGSRNKYKFDEQHGQWRLSKVLPQGLSFPYDFGFLPSTRGDDGDPVNVLLLMDEAAFPGCVVPARLIGVLDSAAASGPTTPGATSTSTWAPPGSTASAATPSPAWPAASSCRPG
jgi:inorganic pyrophosphatase